MRLKFLGTEIYISFLFTAVVTLMLACDKTGLALPVMFSVFVHEVGHLFVMWLLNCAPKSIRLIPASVQITKGIGKRYQNDILIALAGPAVNILLFGTLYLNYLVFKNQITLIYALINLIVALFNLLPVNGLDGGTVIFSLIAEKTDINRANVILKIITLVISLGVLTVAVIMTVKGKINISLYIISLYLFTGIIIKM